MLFRMTIFTQIFKFILSTLVKLFQLKCNLFYDLKYSKTD